MKLYPLKLDFIAKTAIWGGDSLRKNYGKNTKVDPLSETWELTVRENEMSVVQNGALGGMTLGEVIEKAGRGIVSDTWDGDRFPLLIKFIDAKDSLSVQVHPTDEYALAHENDPGKTEMWIILDAEEGASLIYGSKAGLSQTELVEGLRERRFEEVLAEVPAKKGDVFFIPSGLIHAIGKGLVVAEIQQNSDLTYRVYDFDRRQKDGTLRPLHVEKAMAVATAYTAEEIEAIRYSRRARAEDVLADCSYFSVRRHKISGKKTYVADKTSFHSLLCVEGGGSIVFEEKTYPIVKGNSYFIPADLGEYRVFGEMTVIHTTL